MIRRKNYLARVSTALARQLAATRKKSHYFDLETAAGRARLSRPELTLAPLDGLVVIDPALLPSFCLPFAFAFCLRKKCQPDSISPRFL